MACWNFSTTCWKKKTDYNWSGRFSGLGLICINMRRGNYLEVIYKKTIMKWRLTFGKTALTRPVVYWYANVFDSYNLQKQHWSKEAMLETNELFFCSRQLGGSSLALYAKGSIIHSCNWLSPGKYTRKPKWECIFLLEIAWNWFPFKLPCVTRPLRSTIM